MVKKFLTENNITAYFNESMQKHTSFKVGGYAVCVAMPDTVEKASALVKFLKENNIKNYYLGNGSNVIFSDEGFDGVELFDDTFVISDFDSKSFGYHWQ